MEVVCLSVPEFWDNGPGHLKNTKSTGTVPQKNAYRLAGDCRAGQNSLIMLVNLIQNVFMLFKFPLSHLVSHCSCQRKHIENRCMKMKK